MKQAALILILALSACAVESDHEHTHDASSQEASDDDAGTSDVAVQSQALTVCNASNNAYQNFDRYIRNTFPVSACTRRVQYPYVLWQDCRHPGPAYQYTGIGVASLQYDSVGYPNQVNFDVWYVNNPSASYKKYAFGACGCGSTPTCRVIGLDTF